MTWSYSGLPVSLAVRSMTDAHTSRVYWQIDGRTYRRAPSYGPQMGHRRTHRVQASGLGQSHPEAEPRSPRARFVHQPPSRRLIYILKLIAIEIADTNSDEQLRSLAEKTFILATTVGPYVLYGETAFKACAEAGTHYLDITGESPWTWRMIKKYEATAKRTGAIMVPQVGIESSPTDLCTWALAQCLRKKLGAKTAETFVCIHELK